MCFREGVLGPARAGADPACVPGLAPRPRCAFPPGPQVVVGMLEEKAGDGWFYRKAPRPLAAPMGWSNDVCGC